MKRAASFYCHILDLYNHDFSLTVFALYPSSSIHSNPTQKFNLPPAQLTSLSYTTGASRDNQRPTMSQYFSTPPSYVSSIQPGDHNQMVRFTPGTRSTVSQSQYLGSAYGPPSTAYNPTPTQRSMIVPGSHYDDHISVRQSSRAAPPGAVPGQEFHVTYEEALDENGMRVRTAVFKGRSIGTTGALDKSLEAFAKGWLHKHPDEDVKGYPKKDRGSKTPGSLVSSRGTGSVASSTTDASDRTLRAAKPHRAATDMAWTTNVNRSTVSRQDPGFPRHPQASPRSDCSDRRSAFSGVTDRTISQDSSISRARPKRHREPKTSHPSTTYTSSPLSTFSRPLTDWDAKYEEFKKSSRR